LIAAIVCCAPSAFVGACSALFSFRSGLLRRRSSIELCLRLLISIRRCFLKTMLLDDTSEGVTWRLLLMQGGLSLRELVSRGLEYRCARRARLHGVARDETTSLWLACMDGALVRQRVAVVVC